MFHENRIRPQRLFDHILLGAERRWEVEGLGGHASKGRKGWRVALEDAASVASGKSVTVLGGASCRRRPFFQVGESCGSLFLKLKTWILKDPWTTHWSSCCIHFIALE